MKTKQEMIDNIRDKIGRKDLSFGCRVLVKHKATEFDRKNGEKRKYIWKKEVVISHSHSAQGDGFNTWIGVHEKRPVILYKNTTKYKVLGHLVRLGDVLDWFKINRPVDVEARKTLSGYEFIFSDIKRVNLHSLRTKPRLPLNDQSADCVAFIHSLLPQDDK